MSAAWPYAGTTDRIDAPSGDAASLSPVVRDGDDARPRPAPLTTDDLSRLSLTARFALVAAARPDAPAIVDGDTTTTFAQLDARAWALARAIEGRLGGEPGPVAVLLGHRPEAIVAMLAVARSGRTFVGLDPTVPVPRLAQMQRLAGAAACVVDEATEGTARDVGFGVTIDVGASGEAVDDRDRSAPQLAEHTCVLFTSGSTGEPKGIIWHEGTLMKDALAGQRFLAISPTDRVALVLPFSFAAGLSVVIWGLTSGAALHLFDPRRHASSEFAAWVEESQVTTLHTTPTMARALLRALAPGRILRSLRVLTTCGEPLRWEDVVAARSHVPEACTIVNWSGSTEVGVLAMHPVSSVAAIGEGFVPAGTVVDGLRVEIDRTGSDERPDDAPRPDGAGELVVVSDLVAVGYCGQPAELAARFVTTPDGRAYRTGDLATITDDGVLVLRGRRDAAVKIRGYLVEPSEVETALAAAGAVAEAVVCAHAEPAGTRLVAHVVPAPGQVLSISQLRTELRRSLPIYMVPASIVLHTDLPRTDRGKVDRDALGALAPPTARAPYRAPGTEWEVRIAEIWSKVLGLEDPGIDDDFFELGGDSLAVEEVLASLLYVGPDLPTSVFIDSPTIAGLARRVTEQAHQHTRQGDVVKLRTGTGGPTLVCFAGAGGVALAFEPLARRLDPSVGVFGVQMHGLEARALPDFTIEKAARRFLRELDRLRPTGPLVLAGHSYGGLVAYEVAQRLRANGREDVLLVLLDSYLPTAALGPRRQSLRSWIAALPSDNGLSKARTALRLALAGPRQQRGLEHFDAFFDLGYTIGQRFRPRPYDGRAIVYAAERNALSIDHVGWDVLLTGDWELRQVGGDHHTMLREPFVPALAADLVERIRSLTGSS